MNSKLLDHLLFVRENSSFYKKMWKEVPSVLTKLSQLPIVDQKEFWVSVKEDLNNVMTNSLGGSIVFKSGGTTGVPKFSPYTYSEWDSIIKSHAAGVVSAGFDDGDRIANVGICGELAASFILIHDTCRQVEKKILYYPITGNVDFQKIVPLVFEQKINTFIGTTTRIYQLVDMCISNRGNNAFRLNKIFYFGEAIFQDQINFFRNHFPDILIRSLSHSAVDVGLMGYSDSSCRLGEHRVFDEHMVLEILDLETNEPIDETGVTGKLVATNLSRKLLPIVRYPVGDLCQWVDPPNSSNRKYMLLGREPESWSLASGSFSFKDVEEVAKSFSSNPDLRFQMTINRREGRDELIISLVTSLKVTGLEKQFEERLMQALPKLSMIISGGEAHPVLIECVDREQIKTNPRTGKFTRIIDNRFG